MYFPLYTYILLLYIIIILDINKIFRQQWILCLSIASSTNAKSVKNFC